MGTRKGPSGGFVQTEEFDKGNAKAEKLDLSAIQKLGLSPERIQLHAERIQKALEGSIQTTLPILGACTTNNGAVVSWKRMLKFVELDPTRAGRGFLDSAQKYWTSRYLVTCVPAAGAASRYLASLRKFANLTESHLEYIQQLKNPDFEWGDNSPCLSELPEAIRRTGRARIGAQDVPPELKSLATHIHNSFPSLSHKADKLVREIELHLTCQHSVKAITQSQRSELFQSELQNLGQLKNLATSVTTESIIRRHWNFLGKPNLKEVTRSGLRILRSPDEIRSLGENILHRSDFIRSDSRKRNQSSIPKHPETGVQVGGATTTAQAFADQASTGEFISHRTAEALQVYAACRVLLDHFETCPKAFVPATAEEDNFLFLKLVEQMSLIPCSGNVMICPAGMIDTFRLHICQQGERLRAEARNIFELKRTPFTPPWLAECDQSNERTSALERGPWLVMEQGNNLSTIRFTQDAMPFIDSNTSYSRVSAGHGELVHIFSDILSKFPEAECLHIRNIDNIIGTAPERRREIQTPARLFRIVRDCLESLRLYLDALIEVGFEQKSNLNTENLERHAEEAAGALETLSMLAEQDLTIDARDWIRSEYRAFEPFSKTASNYDRQLDTMAEILALIFHWNWPEESKTLAEKAKLLQTNLRKPLSIFGVVRKETDDVGGGPVFSQLPTGETVKLCMEMPHASEVDKQIYFGSRGKATHFNPVLVFFELQTHKKSNPNQERNRSKGRPIDFESLYDDRFWIMASKDYQGQKVCYHETVLYELIGNSATANLLFVEVPRTLFNPHKAITDGLGQDRRSHGFDETLKTQDERFIPGKNYPF